MVEHNNQHAQYIEGVINPITLKIITSKAMRYLNHVKADAIVVTGVSGILLGGAISLKGCVPCIVVRKTTENCHSMFSVEIPDGIHSECKIVFVDDLFSTGKTLARVILALSEKGLKVHDTVLMYAQKGQHVKVDEKEYTIKSIKP